MHFLRSEYNKRISTKTNLDIFYLPRIFVEKYTLHGLKWLNDDSFKAAGPDSCGWLSPASLLHRVFQYLSSDYISALSSALCQQKALQTSTVHCLYLTAQQSWKQVKKVKNLVIKVPHFSLSWSKRETLIIVNAPLNAYKPDGHIISAFPVRPSGHQLY